MERIQTFFSHIANILLPNRCLLCLTNSSLTICELCTEALPRIHTGCPICLEPNYHGEVCGSCIRQPKAYDRVLSPFLYQGATQHLISQFKRVPLYKGNQTLYDELEKGLRGQTFDCILPIPYHWKRLLKKGHNPVRELALHLAQSLNIFFIDGLIQTQLQHSQKGLNKPQRLTNSMGLFSINPKLEITHLQGQNVLLIDDVLTTGATANSAARILKQAGAKSVCVACLARTPAKG